MKTHTMTISKIEHNFDMSKLPAFLRTEEKQDLPFRCTIPAPEASLAQLKAGICTQLLDTIKFQYFVRYDAVKHAFYYDMTSDTPVAVAYAKLSEAYDVFEYTCQKFSEAKDPIPTIPAFLGY